MLPLAIFSIICLYILRLSIHLKNSEAVNDIVLQAETANQQPVLITICTIQYYSPLLSVINPSGLHSNSCITSSTLIHDLLYFIL